ncbi:FKBP-type peptidyl-prolyl cis-trans isomerase [Reinekea marina]|uniref:Peptidyl-prolyl cis-trans isomerase n=1 Tax=Reinekea marina TaxID=1310421 RepID=A0ABV7WQC8_9GAMM|nr:FKBP-type peptidyl-prolyl cis-trans isomerase [Reinekea marina]MDN3650248.1 FKBP-type peptidyl-prolyl cis-trans isomerase [Reinekea marina]
MQLTKIKLVIAGASVAAVVAAGAAFAVDFDTDESKASYGIGYGFANNMLQQTQGLELDVDAMVKGIEDAFAKADQAISEEEITAAIQALQAKQQAAAAAESAKLAEAAKAEGEEFLATNAKKEGVNVTDSGLQYEVITASGSDVRPTAEDNIKVHYHGTLVNGTVFDSSVDRGEPIEFNLGGVIKGWTEGVQLMAVGDKYRFTIPSDLAYGDSSPSPTIPAGSTLIFEVELLDIL